MIFLILVLVGCHVEGERAAPSFAATLTDPAGTVWSASDIALEPEHATSGACADQLWFQVEGGSPDVFVWFPVPDSDPVALLRGDVAAAVWGSDDVNAATSLFQPVVTLVDSTEDHLEVSLDDGLVCSEAVFGPVTGNASCGEQTAPVTVTVDGPIPSDPSGVDVDGELGWAQDEATGAPICGSDPVGG